MTKLTAGELFVICDTLNQRTGGRK